MDTRTQRRVQFQRRRRQVGLTQESLAEALGVTVSAVTQWERGTTSPSPRHRRRLAELLDVSLAELEVLLDPEAKPADLAAVTPAWANTFTTLEQGAGGIMAVELVVVYGLLQTRAYAEAVMRCNHDAYSEQAIESRVGLRMARQQALTRPDDPLRLNLLLDESVLLRPTGGRAVMRDQIDHLIEVMAWPNVSLRILPLDGPVAAGTASSFSLLVWRGEHKPVMLVTESLDGVAYAENTSVVQGQATVFHYLEASAFDHKQTRSRLERAKEAFR